MITSDQEQQVKLEFLEEATDYLDTIESGLLGLGSGQVSSKQVDALLRAAHSIKGGAAMMGYTLLSSLGHKLEDYFKIVQYGKAQKPDAEVERLMLATIDKFRQIVALNRQGKDPEPEWLTTQVHPIFDRLRERLGEFDPEDEANMLASESGEDILTFLFESEVETTLTKLEESLAVNQNDSSTLYDELIVSAEDLAGFAEMVELPALVSLCQSIIAHLTAQPHQLRAIAPLAIAAWRRTQAMVLIGQTGNLPTEIELPGSGIPSLLDTIDNLSAPALTSSFNEAETISNSDVMAISEAETVAEWGNLDLHDFTIAQAATIAELGNESEIASESAMPFGAGIEAKDFAALTDSFGLDDNVAMPALSTITHSDELEPIELSERDPEAWDSQAGTASIAHSITIDEIDTHSETSSQDGSSSIAPEERIVDAFEMLDLSSDLSLDTDAPDVISALSGFLSDLPQTGAPEDTSSTSFKIVSTKQQKDDYLAQEAAELLSALDAAPEVTDVVSNDKDNPANAPASVVEQTIRVATKQLDEIGDLFGELTIDRNGLNLHLQGLRQLVFNLQAKVKQLEQSNFKLREAYDSAAGEETGADAEATWEQENTHTISSTYTSELDLLEFDRYDERHILAQEVMDNIVQIEELTTDLDFQLNEAERTNRELNRTAKQLQTGLTQVRMRPISELFNRFPRAMRNLSIEHGKPIDLQLKGGSTLVERSILEALNDPLMHLLRNAFDHGIEPSQMRRENGKPETGTIEISATYRGNQTVITIKDDGGGIDLDKIRAKVKKMGISDTEIANFKESELIELIFEPGFSTAKQVTDLSGRGVGMDVVRTNIRELRGDIFVDTKLGKGTTFTITVPFTLSVVRVLLIEIDGLWLAVPSNIVEEVILLETDNIIDTAGQKMLQWEGFTVRLLQPKHYLHLANPNTQAPTNNVPIIDRPTVLMVDQGQDVVAVEIDKFWGEQEVTIRQPQGTIKMPPGFTGCTILGDGRIVPLVDAIELIRWIDGDVASSTARASAKLNFLGAAPEAPVPAAIEPIQRFRILIVDDSINVRRFVALTLEKAGYLVEQAKDGQEAIEKLQAGLQAQAVVCDVEMPRMDGYGFLATIKGMSQCKHIPVMMLTSRSGDKHRKIAMNLGASAYFAKPFKEQDLLATLSQLLGKK